MADSRPIAAIVAIGNEILSGKIHETNANFLVQELRELGLPLKGIFTIPDELPVLKTFFAFLQPRYDVIFSIGGVGPTHDDVTFAGIAQALGLRLVRNEEFATSLKTFYRDQVNDYILKMADLPAGAELIRDPFLNIPVVRVSNIYILPGDPTIFKKKFLAIKERFRQPPFALKKIYTSLEEGDIAAPMAEAERRFPGVAIGSYPRYDHAEYKVLVTIEGKDRAQVERAYQFLYETFPRAGILRTE
ncbi:MAG: competence/damage-inducible protein A [Elusimicrobia bacterium]|nr:competence/damage-inducible protein A [Elusimicrobiota bacterium]